MKRLGFAALLLAGAIGLVGPARSADFRWANDGDVNSMDPYTRNETFLITFLQNIYEPLVQRDRKLALEPALATSWEQTSPTTWRFHLRHGVKFQGGESFTADDVIFSYQRAVAPGSQLAGFFATAKSATKIDDYTVDFETKAVDPIFVDNLTFWSIMSKSWAEAHNATQAVDLTKVKEENFATRNTNGTGPFILTSREPDRRTTLGANPAWWGKPEHNLSTVEFNVIGNAATRVSALLSGDVDMIYSVPPNDMERLAKTDGIKVLSTPELRTLFMGFDQSRPELLKSDVKGKNPFKDQRVRQAFNEAVDIQAIHQRVMRGQSHPTGELWGPGVRGYDEAKDVRYPYDPAHAKQLLAAAGYPDGFGVTLDCPNDRYMNDEATCQAVTAMLARIGIRVTLAAQTKLKYFAEILNPDYKTSFFMLGWSPSTYDAHNVLYNLAGSRAGNRGIFNSGGYANPAIDTLIEKISTETNPGARQQEIDAAAKILHDDAAFLPLHQTTVVWATRANISLQQEADNTFPLRYVRVEGK